MAEQHTPIPWTIPDKRFVQLQVPKKAPAAERIGYRVYRGKDDFVEVEATGIAEAIEKSGIKEPVKLERIGITTVSIYRAGELSHLSGYGGEDRMQQAMEKQKAEANMPSEQKPAAEV